jgi:hypothetical protein
LGSGCGAWLCLYGGCVREMGRKGWRVWEGGELRGGRRRRAACRLGGGLLVGLDVLLRRL